jgi:DNA polymerase-1
MLLIDDEIRNSDEIKMIMQVHDELVFEVRSDKVAHYAERIKTLMEQAAELTVPLIAEVGIGENWDEAH